eukprot:4674496-Amphidinium_carterae.1
MDMHVAEGTLVDGQKIRELDGPVPVLDGTLLGIGKYLLYSSTAHVKQVSEAATLQDRRKRLLAGEGLRRRARHVQRPARAAESATAETGRQRDQGESTAYSVKFESPAACVALVTKFSGNESTLVAEQDETTSPAQVIRPGVEVTLPSSWFGRKPKDARSVHSMKLMAKKRCPRSHTRSVTFELSGKAQRQAATADKKQRLSENSPMAAFDSVQALAPCMQLAQVY